MNKQSHNVSVSVWWRLLLGAGSSGHMRSNSRRKKTRSFGGERAGRTLELNEDAESAALNTGKDKWFTFYGHVGKSRTSRSNQKTIFHKQVKALISQLLGNVDVYDTGIQRRGTGFNLWKYLILDLMCLVRIIWGYKYAFSWLFIPLPAREHKHRQIRAIIFISLWQGH